jgi:AcrR family transcriptional regulator
MKDQASVKERVLATAQRLFYEQGYQATGINQIIDEAEVAKASLYQHFPSKEILLQEYLLQNRLQYIDQLEAFTADMQPGKEKLSGLFDYRLKRLHAHEFKGCTFCRVTYELPNLDETSAQIIREHKKGIKHFISEQLQAIKPSFSDEDLKETTEMIFNISEGAVLQTTMFASATPMEETKSYVLKLISKL